MPFVLFTVALIFTVLGFVKFVYFISIGYGFSVSSTACGLADICWPGR